LRAARELAAPDDLTPLSLEGLALEMVAAAARDAGTRIAPPRRQWLDELCELLDGVRSPPSLTTIARTVGRHPVYVARAFREAFGCTIGTYVRRARIQRAEAALAGSTESLAQIAARLGFCDQSHFSKAFRRETGMSPAQFRLRRDQ
jgi:AraC family transcriptional regulator